MKRRHNKLKINLLLIIHAGETSIKPIAKRYFTKSRKTSYWDMAEYIGELDKKGYLRHQDYLNLQLSTKGIKFLQKVGSLKTKK